MRSAKLGIVVCDQPSLWKSCNSISQNLIQAYKTAGQSAKLQLNWFAVEQLPYGEELPPQIALTIAKKILDSGIDELVILDHHVDPVPLLVALRSLNLSRARELRYSFHVYGDFSINAGRWLAIAKILRGQKVRLICASERQQQLVSYFEPGQSSQAIVCPFAVNTRFFEFSKAKREEMRAKLGISSAQKLLVYTGRLSMQKCTDRLIEEFARMVLSGHEELHLALAGPIDDIAGVTSGIQVPPGFQFHQFERLMNELPPSVSKKLFILGELSSEELPALYSAGDAFISLSLYHDEDFGMAPAEALSSGLPAVLTNWGGYAAFTGEKIPSALVPVQLDARGLNVSSGAIEKLVQQALSRKITRKTAGDAFSAKFGIQAVACRLVEIFSQEIESPFLGFSWPLEIVSERGGQMTGDLYKEVYERYVQ